jgi:phage terminase large subunit
MDIQATKTFVENWKTTKKIVINRGGTRSGKTYSICQQIMLWLLTGQVRENLNIESGICSVVRKYSTTIHKTVQRDFHDILDEYQALTIVDVNKTNRTYSYQGRTVEFFGADDQQKIRGYKSNILFCNEANELGFKTEFMQLLLRTTDLIMIDFNPSDPYVWINTEIEQKRRAQKNDVDIIVSTYVNNPFITDAQKQEIEYLQNTDPELWRVYGLGEYGKVEGLIIKTIQVINELPDDLKGKAAGMDFGFTNDPTALYICGYKNNRETKTIDLYLDEILYETGLTDSDIIKKFNELGVSKTIPIYGDSANPSTIEEIRRANYNIKAAKKGIDSVKHGLNIMKKCRIFVTNRSLGFMKEQKQYKYKMLSNGEYTNEPIDAFNHAMDAVRYYCLMNLSATMTGFGFANTPKI